MVKRGFGRLMKHGFWLVMRWLAGFAAGMMIAAVLLVWRLIAGPVSLDYLIPYVADGIAEAEPGLVVAVDHTLLSLGANATIEIVARGVHLSRSDGQAQLVLPELVLGLSARAALSGSLAPTRIVLRAPQLRLVRAADGSFHLGLADANAASQDWGEALLRDLNGSPERNGPVSRLREVAINGAALTIDDRTLDIVWHAKRADLTLFRRAEGLFGDLNLVVDEGGGTHAELRGDISYVKGATELRVMLTVAGLVPARFSAGVPPLPALAALDLPVSGEMRVALDPGALRIDEAWCALTLGAGRMVHPALPGGSIPIASGSVRAAYDPAKRQLGLERLALDLGGPKLELSGTVDGLDPAMVTGAPPTALALGGKLRLTEVPIDALGRYWPEQLSPHSRAWITSHVHEGIVTEATAQILAHADLEATADRPVRVDSIAGTLAYRGISIQYFPPLTPLRGVDGTGTFDRTRLDLTPSAGAVMDVKLAGGTASLYKLDTDDETATIDLGLKGPVKEVLQVLNEKPLQYAQALKIDPAEVGGDVDGGITFTLPLKHDLTLDMVDFGAHGQLTGVAIRQVIAGRDLTDGTLRLKLDRNALKLDGTGKLADVPATLTWTESLKAKDPIRSRYSIKARLDDAARQRLGVDVAQGMLQGPVDVDAAYTVQANKHASASVTLDLTAAAIEVRQLDWRKSAGIPATGTLDLDLDDGRLRAVRQAVIKSEHLDAQFAVALDDAGSIAGVDVSRLVAGATDIAGRISRRGKGGWRVDLKGASFDASGLLANLDRGQKSEAAEPPLVIDAALDRLVLGPGREAHAVKAQLYSDGIHWQAISIDLALGANAKASLRLGQAAGDHHFRLTTNDFGALLQVFDVSDNVEGGHLDISGQAEDNGPRRLFRGKIDGTNYRIVHAPAFARLLSLASFSGIAALLSGEGIPFTNIKGDFILADDKLEVKALRAYGGAIGIRTDGVYDFAGDTLDLSGTLVPAYTINNLLGNIPVLGPALVGEGVFGVNFRVAGAVSDIKISVNPLGIVAPGFFRRLFLFDAPEPSPSPRTGSSQRP
ncbi:MAG TPA: AsmA-like C-terminal domain-containing protein [Stellaceae bacterium]|nr:AsmA-like C-terminal domain-containing protein [Stellaceae bacterium]